MLRSIPAWMLTEWMAYHSLEPFGDELMDIHMAEIKALLFNANRSKSTPAVEPKKMRLWKIIEAFDPQKYFDGLKAALTFKQWE